jgi:hypothetical protein
LTFVYIHILWFACWIAFGIEDYPFGLLSQILQLTLEVRSYAAAVEVQRDQSQSLLDLSRRTLALTAELRPASDARPG